jgi:prepilin-type N-terminal cleavage/methylation domain-containing protein
MASTGSRREGADAGFTLVEVVVAMVLLALLALATLPALATGMRSAADSSSTTSATAAMSAVVEQARMTVTGATAGACAKLQQFAQTVPTKTFRDAQGRALPLTMTSPDCSTLPAAVTVTVSVTQPAVVCSTSGGAGCVISTATRIYVPS